MNVLSLFDGMSCGQIALRELGVNIEKYYASEVDKFAIAQTTLNFPDTIELGNVENWREWNIDWGKIDLLIGGSPCQGFSFAGKQLAFDDPRSRLFFVYVDILNHIREQNKRVKFLLENVIMKQEHINVITEHLGVFPVMINSALVSAQNRKRLYWSNIKTRTQGLFGDVYTDIPQPADRGLVIKDILEEEVEDKFFIKDEVLQNLIKHKQRAKEKGYGFGINPCKITSKMNTISVGGRGMSDLIYIGVYQRHRGKNKGGIFVNKTPTLTSCSYEQNNFLCISSTQSHATVLKNKSTPLVASGGMGGGHVPMIIPCSCNHNNYIVQANPSTEIRGGVFRTYNDGRGFRHFAGSKFGAVTARAREDGRGQLCVSHQERIRRLTPTECARLQTIPEWYKWQCSDSQAYKMLGNGWTVEVIKHIFRYL